MSLKRRLKDRLSSERNTGIKPPHFNATTQRGTASAVRYAERGTFADPEDCTRFEQLLPVLHELADIAEVSAERRP